MERFHINPRGNVSRCQAAKGMCPFGGDEDHFPDMLSARDYYEKAMGAPPLRGLSNRHDSFIEKVHDTLKQLHAQAKSERERELYSEILERYEGAGVNQVHRIAQAAAAKAEVAYEFEKEEDAQVYYNVYMAISTAESVRRSVHVSQENLDQLAPDSEWVKVKQSEIRKQHERLERKLNSILLGKEKFDLWEIIEAEDDARLYRLKEIESTHPRIRDILAGADDAVLGKVTEEERQAAIKEMENNGQRLLSHLESIYGKEIPSLEDRDVSVGPVKGLEEYELMGGGAEMNVYLHRPTMMVYKVRHSVGLGFFANGDAGNFGRKAVVKLQERYENHNLKGLDAIGAQYLKTYFLSPKDSSGNEAALVVQPYLDPREYGPYDPNSEENRYLRSIGFTDAHQGNMSMELKSGKLVLFDCIFVSE